MSVSGLTVPELGYALKFDDSASPVLYLAEGPTGAATSAALWRIMRITTSSGVVIEWADGNDLFDNVWDNRASLSYS